MENERDKLVDAVREVASGSRRNKTARLREIFDEVEKAKAKGAGNKQIVEALEANGLFFNVNTFKNARSRILKERALEAIANVIPSGAERSERPVITKSISPAIPMVTHPKVKQDVVGENPLAGLSGEPKVGEFSPIPTAKFEVDNS